MGRRGLVLGAVVAALLLGGCSASPGSSGESWPATCDDGWSFGDREKGLRTLLEAAGRADTGLACTVLTGTPPGMDLGRELGKLNQELRKRGITPENALIQDLSESGPTRWYRVTGPVLTELEPLELLLVQQKDSGYRVSFPVPDQGYL